jgi:hypothetical protein
MRFWGCFFITGLWLFPAHLAAAPAPWWCTLSVQVAGNPKHFLLYGRDSWEGETTMRCQLAGEERVQSVNLAFFSKNSGFGANRDSILTVNMTLWTVMDPHTLAIDVTAPGLSNGSVLYWQMNTQGTEIAASVWTGSESGVAQSLSLGTFTLRALLFRGR